MNYLRRTNCFLFLFIFSTVWGFASQSCVVVIFGATGDLTSRKLIPALYQLNDENTVVVGVGLRPYDNKIFREQMQKTVANDDYWDSFKERLFYHSINSDSGYQKLNELLKEIDCTKGTNGNRIYYLATSPNQFLPIIENLSRNNLIYTSEDKQWSRVIIEKPFGYDLQSAIDLHEQISRFLDESQTYRVDHYLGKEGVLNLMTLRFSGILESIWNGNWIDHIKIMINEEIGIGTRANFWEQTGYLRDIFQNHLLQLLAITAMDPSDDRPKIKILEAIKPLSGNIIRGQYGPGIIQGQAVSGYRQEAGVPENSFVETFVAAKIFIDHPRWKNVPFYISGGKRLSNQKVEIALHFKEDTAYDSLVITIQPNSTIRLIMKDGSLIELYRADKDTKNDYARLLLACMQEDKQYFVHIDELLAAWELVTPILDQWKVPPKEPFPNYEAGTDAFQALHFRYSPHEQA